MVNLLTRPEHLARRKTVTIGFKTSYKFQKPVNDLQKELEMNLTETGHPCVGRKVSACRSLPLQGLIYLILLAGIGIPTLLRAAVERVLLSGLVFLPDFCRFTVLFNHF